MGREKTTVVNDTTQNVTERPMERATNELQFNQLKEFDPIQRQLNANGGNLVNMLLTGQALPGYLKGLPGGISPDVTQGIVDQSLRDIAPSFQSNGILDSGVAASIAGRTAGDIRMQSEQFNLQNLLQLLNLGVGGQAQVQQPILGVSGQLGGRLAGLRSINSTGTTTTMGMNPFLRSFQTSAGNALGSNFSGPSWLSAAKGGT